MADDITALEESQVFVFGSNLGGNHVGGAAKQAADFFDAEMGVGEGLTGDCYAFPTLNEDMQQYSEGELVSIRAAFYRCCRAHPELTFLLTKVGCDIAGYGEDYMKNLFRDAPKNVVKPKGW